MTTDRKIKRAGGLELGLKTLRLGMNTLNMEEFVVQTIELLMDMERSEHLQELKQDGVRDKGNGSYARSFKSLSRNAMCINVPRTRTGAFKPFAIEFLKYSQEQVNDLVLKLYSKGMTTRDVSEVLENFFGTSMSFSQVSSLAEKFYDLRTAWESSPVDPYYKAIFCDALYITVRRDDSYSKEAVHVAFGVRQDNKRELLVLDINPTEGAASWGECFKSLKKRGVEKVGCIIADGLSGLENEVHSYFPGALFQRCVVHKMRNVSSRVRTCDRAEVAADLKHVFDNFEESSSLAMAQSKLQNFIEKWSKKYPQIHRSFNLQNTEYYFTYVGMPCSIRRMIYTTNSIESLNKLIRKATKNKQSFEKPDRLLDYLFVVIKDFEARSWMKHPVSAFENCNVGHN